MARIMRSFIESPMRKCQISVEQLCIDHYDAILKSVKLPTKGQCLIPSFGSAHSRYLRHYLVFERSATSSSHSCR